jgi:Rrf2 family nitric oxide-sensitive transcriptional repressor
MYVALKKEEQSTIQEIADSYGISKNHLMKVVQALNNRGYLIASRGKNGGLRLKGDPRDINIGALVRDTERDLELVECFGSGNRCAITPACQLKKVFADALEGFFEVLDQYTLADLLPQKHRATLSRILKI